MDILVSDNFKTKKFTIETNSLSYQILSRDLYSDKIGSFIRETASNCRDANKSSGSNKPFIVHLPNEFENFCSFRDYGPGLSEDEIVTIYTVYFKSTKRNSDDQVGCFGLGAKTIFCVGDSATITSWKEGIKYIYTAYIGNDGTPDISLLTKNKSDEPDGLEVKVPVNKKYFKEYEEKARYFLSFYDPPPTILGADIKFSKENVLYKGKDWEVSESGSNLAIMGAAPYEIEQHYIGYSQSHYLKHHLFFDIGELDITASRESLSYTTKTIKAIQNKLDKVKIELKGLYETEINKAPTYWDACCTLKSSINGYCDSKLLYKGKHIKTILNCPPGISLFSISTSASRRKETIGLRASKYTYIGIPDLERLNYSRFAHFLETKNKEEKDKGNGHCSLYYLESEDPAKIDDFLRSIDFPKDKIIRSSSLPDRPKKETVKRPKELWLDTWCPQYKNFSALDYENKWPSSAYYIELQRGRIYGILPSSYYGKILSNLELCKVPEFDKYINQTIIAIPKAKLRGAKKAGLKELKESLVADFNNYVTKSGIDLNRVRKINNLDITLIKFLKKLPPTSPLASILRDFTDKAGDLKKDPIYKLAFILGIQPSEKAEFATDALHTIICDNYPLFGGYLDLAIEKECLDYIVWKDNQKSI